MLPTNSSLSIYTHNSQDRLTSVIFMQLPCNKRLFIRRGGKVLATNHVFDYHIYISDLFLDYIFLLYVRVLSREKICDHQKTFDDLTKDSTDSSKNCQGFFSSTTSLLLSNLLTIKVPL